MAIRQSVSRVVVIVAVLAGLCLAVVAPVAPAAAFPAGLLPGVAPGETWVVCQGYNNSGISHSGTLRYSLDLTADLGGVGSGGCTGSATVTGGRSVVAPGAGVVAWNDGSGFCLNLDGGDSIKLYHVTGPGGGTRVSAGQVVGKVFPAGQGANNGYAHLHLAAYNGSGCPAANGTPFTGAARLACAPDMSSNGSFNQWSGTRLTNSCGAPPFGSLDEASSPVAGVLRVRGWTADPDAPTQSIDVHVYANSTGFNLGAANQQRDDVAAVFPGYGSSHGFSADLSLSQGGSYRVCAFGINVGGGSNQPLRDCRQVQVGDPQPFGYLDQVSSAPGTITVQGWAVDPSNPRASIDVHAYMDQKMLGAATANQRRDDVDKALSGYGAMHGYTATFAAAAGSHRVCTYAINIGVGDNRELKECKSVTVAAPLAPTQTPAAPSPSPVAAPTPGALTTSRFRCPRRGVAILSWAPAANATSYRFRISWPNRSKKWIGWTSTSNTWMKVTKMRRGAKYQFQVQAISSGGQSSVKQWWFVQRR